MKSTHRFFAVAVALGVSVSLVHGQEGLDPSARAGEVANWRAPAYWTPQERPVSVKESEGVRREAVEALPTSPLPFIGITPCRIADTRGNGFTGAYGPPALTQGSPRNFTLTGQCGIASVAAAVSLNVTVTNTQGPGFILIYPQGGAQPNVSTLNYVAGQTVANAAIVPLGAGGGITVIAGVSGADLILDVNGYYAPAGVGTHNTFLGRNAGNFSMTGDYNTGIGENALFSNTTGESNTAYGHNVLFSNTTGIYNTASGDYALFNNTTGYVNTAMGASALVNNTTGNSNTGLGSFALFNNTVGDFNTASGKGALQSNTSGVHNTANGNSALTFNTTGNSNTAIGSSSLQNVFGSNNIGIGQDAGVFINSGSNNICIGSTCVGNPSGTIRIGTLGVQTTAFLAGVDGTGVTGVPVLVSSSGQLGVASSSRRAKEDVREIADESDGLMRLRPVGFKYKAQIDPMGLVQYGLIAEEVADVYPDLVAYDRDGRPETVRYHLVNALLLNEVQKQHRTAEAQEKTIEQQKETISNDHVEIERLKARLSRLEAQLLPN